MSDRTLLTGAALDEAVGRLDGWSVRDGKIRKEFEFADFVEAFGFMTSAALCAERKNHHPEWFNVYRSVRVDLTTHDAGGVTTWDIELAEELDKLAG
ncbi:MAG: 4a-hydroxytetrahydrobiopterin dehydratase [Gemmatimonadota bacterium]|nr:4a-hydroxytetrahydrobiopterin dehydratase [Gemmatimonadota bacterium]